MRDFALHPEAYVDLEDVWDYISRGSEDAADRVVDEMFVAFADLALMPHVGHRRTDLTSRPLRFITRYDYLIAYAPDKSHFGSWP